MSKHLTESGFGVTVLNGHGTSDPVKVLFTTIHRRELEQVAHIIKTINPKIFYSVEEVRTSSQSVFHPKRGLRSFSKFDWIKKK